MGQILSASVTVTVVPQGYNMGLTGDLMVVAAVLSVFPTVAVYGVSSDLFLTIDSLLQPGTSVYCHFDYIEYESITQGLAVDGYTALCFTPAQDSNKKAAFQITRISVSLDKVISILNFLLLSYISHREIDEIRRLKSQSKRKSSSLQYIYSLLDFECRIILIPP